MEAAVGAAVTAVGAAIAAVGAAIAAVGAAIAAVGAAIAALGAAMTAVGAGADTGSGQSRRKRLNQREGRCPATTLTSRATAASAAPAGCCSA
jgi:hypothetical protein